MEKVQILILDSRLTCLTKKAQAEEILNEVRKQNFTLVFETSDTAKAIFTPKPNGGWSVWEPDTASEVDTVFQPAVIMGEGLTRDTLWRLRKHYNRKWREE